MKTLKDSFKLKFDKYEIDYVNGRYSCVHFIYEFQKFDFSKFNIILLPEPVILLNYINPNEWFYLTENKIYTKNNTKIDIINLSDIISANAVLDNSDLMELNKIKVILNDDQKIILQTKNDGSWSFLLELITIAYQKRAI